MINERKSALDTVSDKRAVEAFRSSPEDALRGERIVSVEADPAADLIPPIEDLAREEPGRFLELVSYLPHLVQDIFIQYYLLHRDQRAIARTLGINQSSSGAGVWRLLNLGAEAICALVAFGGVPGDEDQAEGSREWRLVQAWKEIQRFGSEHVEVNVRAPRNLGEFEIGTDDVNLAEFFAPRPGVRKC